MDYFSQDSGISHDLLITLLRIDIIAPASHYFYLSIHLSNYPSIRSGQYIGSYAVDVYQNGRVNPFVLVKENNKFYLDLAGERYLSYLAAEHE